MKIYKIIHWAMAGIPVAIAAIYASSFALAAYVFSKLFLSEKEKQYYGL